MKTFKQYINEAKLSRKKVKDLKRGDVIQPNVTSVKELQKTWGEVMSIVPDGKDTVVTLRHVEFPNGERKDLGTTEKQRFMSRQVMAVRVE